MTPYAFLKKEFEFDYDDRWYCYLALLVFLIVFRIITILGIQFVRHIKR